jgi:predicted PurR-regulated permease PerM
MAVLQQVSGAAGLSHPDSERMDIQRTYGIGTHMTPLRTKLENNLGWIALSLLLLGCLWVVRPFFSAFLWAVVLSFSVWPAYHRLLRWFGGRHTIAALIIALGMICVVLLPFVVAGLTLGDNVKELSNATRRWLDAGPPAPPGWLAKVPLVGTATVEKWQSLAGDSSKLIDTAKRFVEPAGSLALKAGLKLGGGLFEMTLSILITFFLLRDGLSFAERLKNGVGRIAGDRGRHLLEIAGNTVRGVVYGILGTALVQAVMAGVGFAIAGVPGAALLALLTFFFSVIPMGPPLIWLPASLWLFHEGSTGWGIFMLVWGVGVSTVDNFVKPWLISQGSDMPFLLILFGVLGGAFAFGFIGVFIGPTLLAVGYRVVGEWAATNQPEPSPALLDPSRENVPNSAAHSRL